jgi:transposase-like protein
VFKGRHFDQSVILLCVRWYLAYNLSLRNLEEMMAERGISVDHATIHRWTVHYAPLLLERFNRESELSLEGGTSMKHISKFAVAGSVWTPRVMQGKS